MTIVEEKRREVGWTQLELAKRSGVFQSVISDIESGKTKFPRVETIKRLGQCLGFDWTAFYTENKEDPELEDEDRHGG